MSFALDSDRAAAASPRPSSLRSAFLTMALVPAGCAGLIAVVALLLAPGAAMLAAIAVALFAVNALAMPLLLDRRITSRLTAIADVLRAARDGRFERVPHRADADAIGDIARLANDIVAAQAEIGRYAMSLHNAEEFSRISDQTLHRLAGGARDFDRMLDGLQATANSVSRSSERVAAGLDAAAATSSHSARDFATAASRATRAAESMVGAVATASAMLAQPQQADARDTPAALALDVILMKLDALGRAQAGRSAAPDLGELSETVTAPVLARLSDLAAELQRSLGSLEMPIREGRGAIEARLNELGDRIAASPRQSNVEPNDASIELAALAEAMIRLEARITEQHAAVPPVIVAAPAHDFDIAPFVDSVERLERRLIELAERPVIAADPVDLRPVLSGLGAIESKLTTIEAAAAIAAERPASVHPDAGLVAEFDAARAPLQRLLVAFRLAVRDIGLESARLRTSIDGIATPAAALAPPLDLSPLGDRLDEVAARLASLEAATQQSVQARPAHPDLGLLAEFEAGKAPLQRILVGLRLALREIADSAAQFRETVGQIAAPPAAEAVLPPVVDLSPIAARLDQLALRFEAVETSTRDAIKPPSPAAIDSQILPQLAVDRNAMSAALTGLKLMMREMADNAATLRAAAEALPGKVEIIAPAIDLSSITGPLDALRDELAAGHGVLAEMHAQMGREAEALRDQPAHHADLNAPSLVTTLSLMSSFSSAVETRFTDIEAQISEVARRYGGSGRADGRAAAEELVARLLNAASELRGEVGKFLAVGAALSREIELAAKDRGQSHGAADAGASARRR